MGFAAKISRITAPFFFLLLAQSPFSATITYQEDSTTNFKNPERGIRQGNGTIDREYFGLESYRNVDVLPQSVLNNVASQCANYRNSGKKIIPRFYYAWTNGGDAPLQRLLGHIEQIGPVLRENADVIALVEVGFLGCFGEWHYFNCNDQYGNNNPASRKAVLFKLLDVMPKDRMVALRYNFHKREIFGDSPLGPDSAFSGSHRARTGAHNDCFRYDASDRGTYQGSKTVEWQKDYLSQDNRYVPQEGEYCGTSSLSVCDSAIKDFKRMHWDGISGGYESQWNSGGCTNYIYMHWGYRLVLRKALLPDSVRPGSNLIGSIKLQNVGWGKIYNPRGCELVFINNSTKAKFIVKLDNDPRHWCMTDSEVNVPLSAPLPSNMPEGSYQMYLNLPDPYPSLHDRKEYSIRLANNNVWDDATGYNSLLHNVVVSLRVNTQIAKAIQGMETFRVTKNNGTIKFTFGNFAAPTRLTMEVFSLSGVKLWGRTVMAVASGVQTIGCTGCASGIHLVRLSFGDTRSQASASGAARPVIFKLQGDVNAAFGHNIGKN